jgi:hypothetical protein
LPGGILWEPADWVFTTRDWLQGDFSWWDIAGFLPILSHGIVRGAGYVDDIVDASKRAEDIPIEKIIWRKTPGADGALSRIRKVIDPTTGKIKEVWHEVIKEGKIIHRHQKYP